MNFKSKSFLSIEELTSITSKLSNEDSGLLISVLTKLWTQGENQSELPLTFELKDELKNLLSNTFISSEKYLSVSAEFTENGLEEKLSSTRLKATYEKLKSEKLDEDLISARLAKKQKKQQSMLEMVNKKAELTRLYISEEERCLEEFKGWFPLPSFEEDGAAYNLRDEHVEYLTDKFSDYGIDLDSQFNLMFHYLKPKFKRKKFGYINSFILNWISNHIRSNSESLNKDKLANSLIDEFTQLIEMSNTENV